MESNTKSSLSTGIKTVSIIQIVLSGLAIIFYIIGILLKDSIDNLTATMDSGASQSIPQLVFHSIISLAIITGILLILSKKSAGVYIYFTVAVVNIFYSVFTSGFSVLSFFMLLILPILMAFFISQSKETFALRAKK